MESYLNEETKILTKSTHFSCDSLVDKYPGNNSFAWAIYGGIDNF